jgi:hypothetical protein
MLCTELAFSDVCTDQVRMYVSDYSLTYTTEDCFVALV